MICILFKVLITSSKIVCTFTNERKLLVKGGGLAIKAGEGPGTSRIHWWGKGAWDILFLSGEL